MDAKVKADRATTPTGLGLYSRFFLAGALCCGVTHGSLTPVDVVKTRMQLEPKVYNKGMVDAFSKVIKGEGAGALLTGLGPTLLGYFLQGGLKFGGYEFWKKTIIEKLGVETATQNRTAVYLTSSALCEFFADIALCPLEATRIRLVSQPTFASGLMSGFVKIGKNEGFSGFYSGFGPILFKQIPYTMGKFVVFERVSELIYKVISKPKSELSNSAITTINLGSGLVAGLAAAVVSQPADTMLSKINKTKGLHGESTISRLYKIGKELGLRGSFSGLPLRLLMVGTLTAGQFVIYGDCKRLLGVQNAAIELAK